MIPDPKSVLEVANLLADLGTKVADLARLLAGAKPLRHDDAYRQIAQLIEVQGAIQQAHQQALDDLGAAIDANSQALNRLQRAMARRTQKLDAALQRIEHSNLEDRDQLVQFLRREITNAPAQQRALESLQSTLHQHLESARAQSDEISRLGRQLTALKTLLDIRLGGQG